VGCPIVHQVGTVRCPCRQYGAAWPRRAHTSPDVGAVDTGCGLARGAVAGVVPELVRGLSLARQPAVPSAAAWCTSAAVNAPVPTRGDLGQIHFLLARARTAV
jgi:hypothetical protein